MKKSLVIRVFFVLVAVLFAISVVAEIFDQQNTPELAVFCQGERATTAGNASLRFPAASDMEYDANVGRYFHNDPFDGSYLDIPYSFHVPGLRTPSYARSKGDAWSKIIACPELSDSNEYDGDRLLDRPKIGIAYNGGIGKTSQYDMGWHRIVEPASPAKFVTHMDRILRSRINGSWSVAPYYSRSAVYDDGYGENVPLEELKLEFTRHAGYVNVTFADGHVAFNATWEQFDECAGVCYDKELLAQSKFQMNLVPTPQPEK